MKLSVIIPCRNEVNFIEECIEAIYSNDLPLSIELSVVVVDGMSDDGTRELIQQLKEKFINLFIVDNIERLTPFAFNLGINFRPADYYQIVGARNMLSENYLKTAISKLSDHSDVWCVGGLVNNVYINKIGEIISKAMSTAFGMGLGNFRTLLKSGYTDTVGSPMYPSWVFEKIGYFDEKLIRNQDDDFNFRVTQSGGKIWFEYSISMRYYVRGNFKSLYKQFFQYGYWKVYVNKKHCAVTTFRQLVPPFFVMFLFSIPLLFFISSILFYLSLLGLIFYSCLSIYFGFKKSNNLKEFTGIIKTFPILHFSYGFGYLQGLVHFFILRKKPSNNQKSLSR
jgi:GT2 family glycosyltransferase